jgi:hypothetical protein
VFVAGRQRGVTVPDIGFVIKTEAPWRENESRRAPRRAAQLRAAQTCFEEIVVAVFERERLQLTQGAKVERFVGIVAEKRTRRTIRRMKP